MNTILKFQIKELLTKYGACDVGFTSCGDSPNDALPNAVSFVIHLSDAVIDEITNEPTHSYFHHYRTVNALIDQLELKVGFLLESNGYRYLPVAASQSINGYQGRYSHKKAACLAGLGSIGKNNLFLHRVYGPRVRLGTVFTDCPLPPPQPIDSLCVGCNACVEACPSGALTGKAWEPGCVTSDLFDAETCSTHMKKAYQLIGRGAVCGICMRVCPLYQNSKEKRDGKA